MKRALVGSLTLATLMAAALSASAQRPRDGAPPPPPPPPRYRLGELMPPQVRDRLTLTEDQGKQLADLEAEVRAKLERILTPAQREQLEVPRPPAGEDEDRGRPVEAVARELGVTPDQFRAAFRKVTPARPGEEPTREQRQKNRKALSEALGVSPERLDEVMDKYRPGGRGTNGADRPARPE
ncbi:hypothetical protein TA3x_001510 [Tundrisphaera sp. TA3]|uniref:hypothetical protein n=1 Tax=Tundrisphaera sp. TA3 TaxID=3435775 RepID=UPI003EBAF6D7